LEQSQRRVERFGREMQQTWDMEFEYERRVQELMRNMSDIQQVWAGLIEFDGYREAKRALTEFETYKNTTKRVWVTEKRDLDTLLGNIQTKLRTYNMQPYYPPEGLTLNVRIGS
jgi:chromosome segregation ATPase